MMVNLPTPGPDQVVDEVRVQVRAPFRRGELCPRCGVGMLDYNGLLDLECPSCGYSEGPGGGCT